jgi:hypothetical protein
MKVHELIAATLRGRDFAELAHDAGDVVTAARLRIIGKADTEWKNFQEPGPIRGLAKALGVSVKTMVLANAESLGLIEPDEESSLLALMPPGTSRLQQRHLDVLLPLIRWCIADADAQVELASAKERIAELE